MPFLDLEAGQELVSSTIAYVERILFNLGFSGVQVGPRTLLSILLAPGALVYLRRWSLSKTSRRPPIVSHWIPWLGSALQIQKDPDSLYRKAHQELGSVFGVRAFGTTMYYVADTDLIMAIYKQPHVFSALPMGATFLNIVFDVSMDAIRQPGAVPEMIGSMHKLLSPTHFPPLLSSFITHTRTQIQNLPLNTPVSLLSITMQPLQNADCAMLFGSSFLASHYDHTARSAFSTFDKNVPLLAVNFPVYFMPDTLAARKTILNTLSAYYDAEIPDDASELTKEFVQIAQSFGWSTRDRAAFGLGTMWPLLGNAPYAAYWLLAFHLLRPEGLTPLVREIDSVMALGQDLSEIVRDSSATPYLEACINETIRLASDSYSVRWVPEGEEEYRLGEYVLKPGDQVACNMRGVHMDERVYARPEAFEPERFLDGGKDKVRGRFIPFGGGFSVCSGRHLAMTQIKAYIVLLLSEFELELEDESQVVPGFIPGGRGFGMIRPVGDVTVRLTKKKPPVTDRSIVDSPVTMRSLSNSQIF